MKLVIASILAIVTAGCVYEERLVVMFDWLP
jgi:hypothetical protein